MFSGQARCFLLAGLCSSALLACSSDATDNGGTAGMSSGGSAAGSQAGGSKSTAGTSSTAGSLSGGGSGTAGASATAGSGGASAGAGGASAGSGGTGGATGGVGGGGAGGGVAEPTAVFDIKGLGANAATVAGTATFTQGATMTKMVLNLTKCPNGAHASHLHLVKDCGGSNGDAAGGHWVPNGEGLGDYTCADTKVTYEFSKPTTMWTVGGDKATDVTQYSFMVHEMGGASPGGRIGCGIVK